MARVPQQINQIPSVPSDEDRLNRVRLAFEEVLEFAEATGVEVKVGYFTLDKTTRNVDLKINGDVNLIETADALADIEYINLGSANTYGIELQPIFNAVHKSNMKKFTGNAHKDKNGKWIKPTGWKAPNIFKLLQQQFFIGDKKEKQTKELEAFKQKYKNK